MKNGYAGSVFWRWAIRFIMEGHGDADGGVVCLKSGEANSGE